MATAWNEALRFFKEDMVSACGVALATLGACGIQLFTAFPVVEIYDDTDPEVSETYFQSHYLERRVVCRVIGANADQVETCCAALRRLYSEANTNAATRRTRMATANVVTVYIEGAGAAPREESQADGGAGFIWFCEQPLTFKYRETRI